MNMENRYEDLVFLYQNWQNEYQISKLRN